MNTEVMNQFEVIDNLGVNGITLTEQELLTIDGGSWILAAAIITGAYGVYQFGEAVGKTYYYITHP